MKRRVMGVICEVFKYITFSGIRNGVIVQIGANVKEKYAPSISRSEYTRKPHIFRVDGGSFYFRKLVFY
jgi:hypothetical protein